MVRHEHTAESQLCAKIEKREVLEREKERERKSACVRVYIYVLIRAA